MFLSMIQICSGVLDDTTTDVTMAELPAPTIPAAPQVYRPKTAAEERRTSIPPAGRVSRARLTEDEKKAIAVAPPAVRERTNYFDSR